MWASSRTRPFAHRDAIELAGHFKQANFLGYDIGNEINCCWSCWPEEGDAWMKRIFGRMHALCPGRVHVNGVDQNPWFQVTTFSPEALMAPGP